MPTLSKFVAGTLGHPILTTTCHETIHTWHPDCTMACVYAVPDAIRFCLRTYATFYIATNLLTKRDPRKIKWKKVLIAIIRSSIFLTMNLVFYEFWLCRIRHLLGFFTLPTLGYTNGILSSYCAILIEEPSRRPALALYLANLASETLFNQLVNHGYLRTIPNGTFIPFAVGLAAFKFLSTKKRLHPTLQRFMSSALQEPMPVTEEDNMKKSPKQSPLAAAAERLPPTFKELIKKLKNDCSRTEKCDHEDSCAFNALKGTTTNFSAGLALSSAVAVLRNFKKIIRSPTTLVRVLLQRENLKIPLFFGLMPLIYHMMRCSLNRAPIGLSSTVRDVASAGVSGAAMLAFPNIAISMFTLWKAIEAIYTYLVDCGYAFYVPYGDLIIYSICTGYVLGCAAVEPHAIRKGYVSFLEGLTGNRIRMFNRTHIDFYGYESSKLYGPHHQYINPKNATLNPFLAHPDAK